MNKIALSKLSNENLQKRKKGVQTLIYIFIPLILILFYAGFEGYFRGGEVDFTFSTIAICSLGGMVSLLPELKNIKEELRNRNL